MAPNKFEKHIKKELQEREIQPSARAWERVSGKLDNATPPTKKSTNLWYAIAASFIGLLIISVVFFSAENDVNTTEVQLVEVEEETPNPNTNSVVVAEKTSEEVVFANDEAKESKTNDVEKVDYISIAEQEHQVVASHQKDKSGIAKTENNKAPNQIKQEMITTKILEIVATVDSLEQRNANLSDAEVNDLLRNAQEEILRDKLFDQNGSVDALTLLTQVEDELDKSFRDEIFDSLKEGFLKVRTAVADRNK